MNLGRWLDGSILVRVTGIRLEQFLNLAATRGIQFWGVRRCGDQITCWLHSGDFRRLRPVARRTGCRVRLLKRSGLIFQWRAVFHRRSMLAGFILCVLLILLSSSFVWIVEIEGLQEADPALVLNAARRLGVAPGTPIYALELNEVARQLVRELPFITWAGLERYGVRIVIKVVEKEPEPPEATGPAHIVAAKDGVVREVMVLAGTPEVSIGDSIATGMVLISGKPAGPDTEGIRARGQIIASVWYTERETVEMEREISVPTGNRHVCTYLTIGERGPLVLALTDEVPFDIYEMVEKTWRPFQRWRTEPLFIEVRRVYYNELTTHVRVISELQALQMGCALAHHRIRSQLDEEAQISQVSCEIIERTDVSVTVEATVVVREDVSVDRPLSRQD